MRTGRDQNHRGGRWGAAWLERIPILRFNAKRSQLMLTRCKMLIEKRNTKLLLFP